MATSKTGSTKKSTTAKSSSRTTATKVSTVKTATTRKPSFFKKASGEPNYPAIIIAEVIGTFVLTLVALFALQQLAALYVGLTVVVLVLAVGAVSGAHLNPAVTFGLWAARRLQTSLVPVYWVAQFVGAILAILLLSLFTGDGGLSFSNFTSFNAGVFGVEVVGTAIFLFGLIAAISNDKLSQTSKAFGVGLSLVVGLLVSGSVFTAMQGSVDTSNVNISEVDTIPREYLVKGATLNPAVALASTENTPSQLSGYGATAEEEKFSRLGYETIFGTLLGAALGTNLYLLLVFMNRRQS